MNSLTCLFCHQPFTHEGRGQPPKFCSTAHKSAFARKLRGDKSNKSSSHEDPTPSPPESTQVPTDERVIGSDGIDYTIPEKVCAPEIWPYMPIQSHQIRSEVMSFERVIRKEIPFDPNKKPSKPAPWE